jgi:membrane protease YdiL (CAAX protease family)
MNYQLNYPELKAVAAIIITMSCYYIYYFLITSQRINLYFTKKYSGTSFYLHRILFNKLAGFIFFACIPGALCFSLWHTDFSSFGITLKKIVENWYWLVGLPALIYLVNYFSAKNPDVYAHYPQMRIKVWSAGTFLLSSLGWFIYLVGYEFLFRGILLLSCAEAFGLWPAVTINIAIYSAIHLTNGLKETIGAIPFGLIACLLMLYSGTLLIPIAMHISLSMSTEFYTIRNNPDMKFIK